MAFGEGVTHLLDKGDGTAPVEIVLALREADLIHRMAGHKPGTCSHCTAPVVYPAAAPIGPPVVCMQCAGWPG